MAVFSAMFDKMVKKITCDFYNPQFYIFDFYPWLGILLY